MKKAIVTGNIPNDKRPSSARSWTIGSRQVVYGFICSICPVAVYYYGWNTHEIAWHNLEPVAWPIELSSQDFHRSFALSVNDIRKHPTPILLFVPLMVGVTMNTGKLHVLTRGRPQLYLNVALISSTFWKMAFPSPRNHQISDIHWPDPKINSWSSNWYQLDVWDRQEPISSTRQFLDMPVQ